MKQASGSTARRPTTVVCLLLFPSMDESRIVEWGRLGLLFWGLEDAFFKSLNRSEE